jgi:WD40 repeat protein
MNIFFISVSVLLVAFCSTPFLVPQVHIHVAADGDFFVTGWNSGNVASYSSNPIALQTTHVDAGHQVGTLAQTPDGRIIVSNDNNDQVIAYNADFSVNRTYNVPAVSSTVGQSGSTQGQYFNFEGKLTVAPAVTEAYFQATRDTNGIPILDLVAGTHVGTYQESTTAYEGVCVVAIRNEVYGGVLSSSSLVHIFDLYTTDYRRTLTLTSPQTRMTSCYYSALTSTIFMSSIAEHASYERLVDLDGTLVTTFEQASTYTHPYCIARRPDNGQVYVTYYSSSRLAVYSSSGTLTESPSIMSNPLAISFKDRLADDVPAVSSISGDQMLLSYWHTGNIFVWNTNPSLSSAGFVLDAGYKVGCMLMLPNGNFFFAVSADTSTNTDSSVVIMSPELKIMDQFKLTELFDGGHTATDAAYMNAGSHWGSTIDAVLVATRSPVQGIIMIDLDSKSVKATFTYSSLAFEGVATLPHRGEVWGGSTSGSVVVWDITNAGYLRTYSFAAEAQARASIMYFSPFTDTIFMADTAQSIGYERDLDFNLVTTFPKFNNTLSAWGIARRPSDGVVVISHYNSHDITAYNPDGSFREYVSNIGSNPLTLAFANANDDVPAKSPFASGQFMLSHWFSGRINVHNVADKSLSGMFAQPLDREAAGLTTMPNGNVIATSGIADEVYIFTPNGDLVSTLGPFADIGTVTDAEYVNYGMVVYEVDSVKYHLQNALIINQRTVVGLAEIDLDANQIAHRYTHNDAEYSGMAVVPDLGELWASDRHSTDMHVFDMTTKSIKRVVSLGNNGQLRATSMYFSPTTNTMFMSDIVSEDAYERNVDDTASFVRKFAGGTGENPYGIAREPVSGQVFVPYYSTNELRVYNADGTFIGSTETQFQAVSIMFHDKNDDAVATANITANAGQYLSTHWFTGRIWLYNSDHSLAGLFADLGTATAGLTMLPDGNVFAVANGENLVAVLDTTGTIIRSATVAEIANATDAYKSVTDGHYVNYGGQLAGFSSVTDAVVLGVRGEGAGLAIVDANTMSFVAQYGTGLYEGCAVVSSVNEVWAGVKADSSVDVFDLYTRAFKRSISLDNGQLRASSMYWSPSTNTVLMSDLFSNNAFERTVDTDGTFVRSFAQPNSAPELPYGITRNPDNDRVYVPYYNAGGDGTLAVFESDGTFVSEQDIFHAPVSVAFVESEIPECVLEDASCNYQPDPPVVTFSDVVIGNDNLAYYRIQMNASAHWNEYVKVLFPESDNDHCDYPSGQVTWAVATAIDDSCTKQYSVDIPMSDFLGKCGFSQSIRNGDSLLFQQTVQILTNRTCEDGRINQLSLSDVELSETRAITRETQYEIEIIAPTNATAKTGGLEVFGTAFKLDLLGDLTITPDIDTNMPTITGFFVTETQHPYELQDPVFELTGDFNYATFELTGTYCTADNSTRLPCQQTWSYSFQPNETCPDKAQLEGELVQITWNVNCSDGFIGECAPSFAVQPEATFTLNSPVYCFSSDYIELTPALEVYQFDQLTANSADFGASTLGTLTDNGFSVERVFTIDSQLYAEYTVVAAGTGVTLTATTLKKVSTTTSSRGELVLYETNAAEQVITQATTFSVHDTGFGTDESSDFADYRTRFQFTWLNDTTVLLDSTEDLAQTIALSATAISIFTNVQSLRKAGIDERHPVLSKLNSDQHSKEQEDKYMVLFADGDEPRNSRSTVLARLVPASPTNTPAASTASSGFVVSPTVAAAGIALIAVVALVVFAVVRRNKQSPSEKPSLPASSSGVQLTDFAMPVHTSAAATGEAFILQQHQLNVVANMYATDT